MYAPLLFHFGKANPPKTVLGSSSQVITNNVYSIIIKNKTRKQVTTLIITVFMKNSVIISNNKY